MRTAFVLCVLILGVFQEPTLRSNGVFEEVLVGESVTMSCTIPSSIRYCYFRSHNGTILTMLPGEPAETYEYVGNGFDAGECGVRLKNARVSDSEDWTCHVGISGSAHEQNATTLLSVRELMVASLRSLSDGSLVVNSAVLDIPRLEYCRFVRSDGFEPSSAAVVVLPQISHVTRANELVELNVPRSGDNGTCHLLFPSGFEYNFIEETPSEAVQVRKPNFFVSCRVVIGPLDTELLGVWTVYEKFEDGFERRQPFRISYGNPSDPNSEFRAVTTLEHQTTVTNYGATFFYAVRREGTLQSCHLILPDGADLVVSSNSRYPGIRWYGTNSNFGCIISLGPVHEEMIGSYALHGRYSNSGRLLEFRQPMSTFLFNPNDPYEQAYNITTQEPVTHVVNWYTNLAVGISSSGTVMGCYLNIPGEEERSVLDSTFRYPGVQVVSVGSSAACRITIGPFEGRENLFGSWILIGRFLNRAQYTEIRHPFRIVVEDPLRPIVEFGREVSVIDSVQFQVRNEERIQPTIAVVNSRNTDSCHVLTPEGLQFTLIDGVDKWMKRFSYPGISLISPTSRIACAVSIVPVADNHTGEWILISRESRNGNRYERRMPFEVLVGVGYNLPMITHRVNLESKLDIYVNETGDTESCHLMVPGGNTYELNNEFDHAGVTAQRSNRFVSCRATIGPINSKSLGKWIITDRKKDGWEIRQPISITWMNPDAPEDDIYRIATNAEVSYVTNFGAILFPSIRRTGDIQSVHLITPDGSDLMISNTRLFPGVGWLSSNSNFAAILRLGPVHEGMIGDWTLYIRTLNQGALHEIRQPFHLYLYNENDPYEQAYNVTVLNTVNHVINIGASFDVGVSGSGARDGCLMTVPDGRTVNLLATGYPGVTVINTGSQVACRVTMGPMTEELFGNWTLIGKFNNRNIFTETRQPFNIILEDPKNPVEEERNIELQNTITFDTKVGESVDVSLAVFNSRATDSCHLRFPNGLQFVLVDGFSFEGIQIIPTTSRVSCGVTFSPIFATMAGEWMLIARESRSGNLFERQQPIVMYVEAPIPAVPMGELTIFSGNDFYLRLHDQADEYDGCELLTPRNIDDSRIEKDDRYEKYCGYIVKSVSSEDSGDWAIVYGSFLRYKATVILKVTDVPADSIDEPQSVIFPLGRQTRMLVGPEDSRFCRVIDPKGLVHFDDFGRCEIDLKLVTTAHEGVWTLNVALPGRLTAEELELEVRTQETDVPNQILTSVEKIRNEVLLACSLLTEYEFVDCNFEDPQSNIIIPSAGIGEHRYSSHRSGVVRTEGGMNKVECNIRIREPLVQDLGIWRCSVQTSHTTHYGFLTVSCPYSGLDQDVAASLEPILEPNTKAVTAVVAEALVMSCSLPASIRYCWFRSEDGRIYSVNPDVNNDGYEYFGAGFDAGECGMKLHSSSKYHAGRWSCHVGLRDVRSADQVAHIAVTISDGPIQTRRLHSTATGGFTLSVWSYNGSSFDYCRFMRSDGFVVNTDSDVDGYKISGSLSDGSCAVSKEDPSLKDLEEWTVAVKLSVRSGEILTSISASPSDPAPTTEVPKEKEDDSGEENEPKEEDEREDNGPQNSGVWWPTVLVVTSSITLAIAILVIIMNSKKSSNAISWVRSSFRDSFMRKKLVDNQQPISASTA